MFPRTVLLLLAVGVLAGHASGDLAGDVAAWDRLLDAVPAGTPTVALGDQIVPLAVARSWRDRLAAKLAVSQGQPPSNNLSSQTGVHTWPSGNVYYAFNANVSAGHKQAFVDAVREWETAANLHFFERTTQQNYIAVNNDTTLSGGNSSVGMVGNAQPMNIGSTSWNRATLLHEVGHALGLVHEQQRFDRDNFVTILDANVTSGQSGNFVKILNSTNDTAYDFLSVMHYARDAFSSNGGDTIVPQLAYTSYLDLIGRQFNPVLSRKDRQGMAALYGLPPTPTLVVTNTNDSGVGSLRAALQTASDLAADNPALRPTVSFAIPAVNGTNVNFASGVFTIALTASIQTGANTLLDASTQTTFSGNTNAAGPEVVLTRAALDSTDPGFPGVQMIYSGSEVRGLTINLFKSSGVEITGSGAANNVVSGCYVGLNATGTAAAANTSEGVRLHGGAHDNLVGGTTTVARNVISGNTTNGISISESGTALNRVQGNWLGLNAAGTAALSNGLCGVYVRLSAASNTIGGESAGAGNVISGNTQQGIIVAGPANANVIAGNRIGTTPDGLAALPNQLEGIVVFNAATNTLIGGGNSAARNVISGNIGGGLVILNAGTNGTKVSGNYIGVKADGAAALANGSGGSFPGISIYAAAQQTTVGGVTAGERNVISGNAGPGVAVSQANTTGTTIAGNYVGLNATGTAAVANGGAGLQLYGGAAGNTIGGTTAGARNVISGNTGYGVALSDAGTTNNVVEGNYVGLDAAGSTALANGTVGVIVFGGASSNVIGGLVPGAGNVLSGNAGYGVWLSDGSANAIYGNFIGLDATGTVARPNTSAGVVVNNSTAGHLIGAATGGRNYIAGNDGPGAIIQGNGTTLKGNTIGLNVNGAVVANSSSGVLVQASSCTIGGLGLGDANLISGNGNAGVFVSGGSSLGNTISGNSIYGNAGGAIDLNGGSTNAAGLTLNDVGDGDTGPNNLQNFPVLSGATLTTGTTVNGSLVSTPSTGFLIEFYATPPGGPAGIGEARTFLGSGTLTTNTSGNFSFTAPLAATVQPGYLITASATNLTTHDTSEFAPGVAVAVQDSDNDGLPDAWETAHGFNVGVNDANLDADGDGLSNLAEFYAGTDPRDGAGFPRLSLVEPVGSDFRLTLPTAPGRSYRVEYTDNLGDPTAWRLLADQLLGSGGNLQIADPGAAARSSRFYRMRLQP